MGHALDGLAGKVKEFEKIYTLRCSIGMKSSTLPLTSPCSGTKRKTTVPLFFASTGGLRLLSFMPILHLSLQIFDYYNPSLRRISVSFNGLRLPHIQTYIAENSFLFCFLQLPFQVSLLTGFTYLYKVPYQIESDLPSKTIRIR